MTHPVRGMAVLVAAGALALAGCGSNSSSGSPSTTKTYKIGITQIVSHPSLDAAREGFKQALADAGVKATYDEQNAQGDQATATSIASKFASQHLDLVLAIATPAAQAAAQAITTSPVLFTAVTDPVAANLVTSNDHPGANITGTTDMNPVAEQIALVKQLNPAAKTVGVLYSSGEVNSQVQVDLARKAAATQGLTLVEKTITTTSEVLQAAQTLSVDAIYVPTDNNVVAGLDSVIQVAETKHVPIIAGETDSVKKGALITYGLDYTSLGKQTGDMAVRVLTQGADPASMPVEAQKTPKLVINTTAAQRMGVTVPQDLLSKADEKVS